MTLLKNKGDEPRVLAVADGVIPDPLGGSFDTAPSIDIVGCGKIVAAIVPGLAGR